MVDRWEGTPSPYWYNSVLLHTDNNLSVFRLNSVCGDCILCSAISIGYGVTFLWPNSEEALLCAENNSFTLSRSCVVLSWVSKLFWSCFLHNINAWTFICKIRCYPQDQNAHTHTHCHHSSKSALCVRLDIEDQCWQGSQKKLLMSLWTMSFLHLNDILMKK